MDDVQPQRLIRSGEWRSHPQMADYRSEWLSDLLVERTTWRYNAVPQFLGDVQVAGPEYVWFRFWLPEPRQIVEKYFNTEGEPVGIYLPITEDVMLSGKQYHTVHLLLGLWLSPAGRLTVLGERLFEEAMHAATLSDEQVQWAEDRIRAITAKIHKDHMPPALIRNFAINAEQD